jgi:hypothetical protein
VTVSSAPSGTGSVSVSYFVAANTNLSGRSGSMDIAGQSFTVTQAAFVCTYVLSATSAVQTAVAATNSVSVTAADQCSWSASNNVPWISILSGASSNGTGLVTYSAASNGISLSRTGALTIAGQSFAVVQQGLACSYSLSPTNHTQSSSSGSNFFVLSTGSTGCLWSASTTNPWLHLVNGSGAGSGDVGYTVDGNTLLTDRVGAITIAGQSFTVTQAAFVCSYGLSATSAVHTVAAATNTVSVTAANQCSWSVSNNIPWVSILSASSNGTGSVTYAVTTGSTGCLWSASTTNPWIHLVSGAGAGSSNGGYTVDANPALADRVGVITVEGHSLILTQRAFCLYSISPTNAAYNFSSSNGTVSVTAGALCSWTASTSNSWIAIGTNGSGTENGAFDYSIAGNPLTSARTGSIVVAGQVLTVTQAGFVGSFSFASISLGTTGQLFLTLTGSSPTIVEVQASVDLTNWSRLTDLTNSTGRVDYALPPSDTNRFYRALLR